VSAGNVCSASTTVGGQNVSYSWTENHNAADSSLKFRFQSGPYVASAQPVKFIITVSQAFASNASLKNPSPLSSMPPLQVVNGTKTILERSANSVTLGTNYDFVQDLHFGSIAPGTIAVTLEFDAYNVTKFIGPFNVYFDNSSPSNRDEGQSLTAIFGASYKQCYDAADNDLDYRQDCADTSCTGKSIGPTSVCEVPESKCNDGLDNDGNGKSDCADPYCNGQLGNVSSPAKYCGSENGGAAHFNCSDGFDNDGNGETDCHDDGPGTGCWHSGFLGCEKTETSCTDGIDNDRDSDYSETLDTNAGTGVDCTDYQ
jgi:hypothetical protein